MPSVNQLKSTGWYGIKATESEPMVQLNYTSNIVVN